MKLTLQRFIDNTVQCLSRDKRICGLAVVGSWITGEIDEFSDLDLVIVSHDEKYPSVFEDRFAITKSLGNHVSSFQGDHVGEPRLLICLFADPLIHVDLKFVALRDFHDRIEDPFIAWEVSGKLTTALQETSPRKPQPDFQWIEDRFWTWIHYGAVKVARGELFEAIGFFAFLRERVLGPMALAINGKPPRGVRRIERHVPNFAKRLEDTVPILDRKACFSALRSAAQLYKELRSSLVPSTVVANARAEQESMAYLTQIENRNLSAHKAKVT